MSATPTRSMSPREYLAWERAQQDVLVSQRTAHVEHFSRNDDGSWTYRVSQAGGKVELTTGAILVVDEIYAGVFDLPGDD